MKIKMLKDAKGSSDGKVTEEFKKDGCYDVSDELAKAFLDLEVCEETKEGDEKKEGEEGKDDKALSGKDYANKSKGKDK